MEEALGDFLSLYGEEDKSGQKKAMSPPIYQTSNFAYTDLKEFRSALQDERHNSLYTRGMNPGVRDLELKLAKLQGTEDALLFGSGSAAISAGVIALLSAGDHVVCVESCYSWTDKLLKQMLSRFGVSYSFVDGKSNEAVIAAFRSETKLLILESPTSFLFELQDIDTLTKAAHERGIFVLMDNSYASPVSDYPAKCGVDLIAHSATKYIGGHSDVVAGLLCGRRELMDKVFYGPYMTLGATLSPMDAWLLGRGLRTLELRLDRTGQSALGIAKWLENHPKVKRVMHPWLESNPQKELARKQMDRPMGLFSIELETNDPNAIERFCNSLKLFQLAVSWGSYESLAFPAVLFENSSIPKSVVRLSIGIESADSLLSDLEKALEKI